MLFPGPWTRERTPLTTPSLSAPICANLRIASSDQHPIPVRLDLEGPVCVEGDRFLAEPVGVRARLTEALILHRLRTSAKVQRDKHRVCSLGPRIGVDLRTAV